MDKNELITVSTEDGDFIHVSVHPLDDAEEIARKAARSELWESGSDLSDPEHWPRVYTVHWPHNTKDAAVSVDMEYEPNFYATLRGNQCRRCGCTDENACLQNDGTPCHWVEDDLCSACTNQSQQEKTDPCETSALP